MMNRSEFALNLHSFCLSSFLLCVSGGLAVSMTPGIGLTLSSFSSFFSFQSRAAPSINERRFARNRRIQPPASITD